MASEKQTAIAKDVKLDMDECKLVAAALFNYRSVKVRAIRAADDADVAAAYEKQVRAIDALSSKF